MATAMHNAHHAHTIAKAVQTFRNGGEVDTSPTPICTACYSPGTLEKKLSRCSGCKVALYCSPKCAKEDWNGNYSNSAPIAGAEFHRTSCKILKNSLSKVSEMHAIAKQFPWAKPQKDGTYGFMIFRASCNLLGSGREFGWWTQEPCCGDKSRYISGFHLLEEEHLSDSAGWILPPAQTPWLDFTFGLGKPPTSPPPTEHSWSEYYQWRGLPLSSPAALLLHWPLSVYRLLHLLGFAAQRPPKRRFLTVYLLGIETEVNFLPIFGELALLLPNTDLDLVLFGTGVSTLLAKAVSKPFCLASRPFAYTYKAPEESGGGSIRIELSRCGPYYEASNLSALRREKPDALVALNAGLSTYDEWLQVYFASRALAIPFGVTEYGEVSLSVDIVNLRQLPFAGMTRFSHWALTPEERSRIAATPNATFPIEMNPFMYPGPRAQAVQSGPTSYNGYTFVVTPGARP